MRRRYVIILAFPIIAFIFLIGWVLYYIRSNQKSATKEPEKKSTAVEKQTELASDEGIEMELIDEKNTIEYID